MLLYVFCGVGKFRIVYIFSFGPLCIFCGICRLDCRFVYLYLVLGWVITRYNEHMKAYKSNFPEHILGTRHKYTNIQTNLQIPHKTHKDPKLDTLEQFESYKHHKTHKNEIFFLFFFVVDDSVCFNQG